MTVSYTGLRRNMGLMKAQRSVTIFPRVQGSPLWDWGTGYDVGAGNLSGVRPGSDTRNLVLDISPVSIAVNANPLRPTQVEISGVNVRVDNYNNVFSYDDANSIFNGSYGRKHSLVMITSEGFYSRTPQPITYDDFTYGGLIDSIKLNNDFTATMTVVAPTTIFTLIDITELGLTGNASVSQTVSDILSSTVIDSIIPKYFGASSISVASGDNVTINRDNLSGSVWDVLVNLAFWSNCIVTHSTNINPANPYFTLIFKTRGFFYDSGVTFYGVGGVGDFELNSLNMVDDEGSERLVLQVFDDSTDPPTSAKVASSDDRVKKFMLKPERVNLSYVDTSYKSVVLANILNELSVQRRVIELTCSLMSLVQPMWKFYVDYPGVTANATTWDNFNWDEANWAGNNGGIYISSGTAWLATSITYDLMNYTMTIRGEEIV